MPTQFLLRTIFINANPRNCNNTLLFSYPNSTSIGVKGRSKLFLQAIDAGRDVSDYFKMDNRAKRNISNPCLVEAIRNGEISFDRARRLTQTQMQPYYEEQDREKRLRYGSRSVDMN